MSGEEDDKATVVIDISALRKEKEKKEKEIADLAGSLEFSVEPAQPAPATSSTPVIFFEFASSVFSDMKAQLPTGSIVLKDLPSLNGYLKKKTPLVVVFAFDADPKSVNQLCAQLKAKFKLVRTVIVVKKLSPEKVKMHQASPAGAHAYLPWPFTKAQLQKALLPLTTSKAS